MKPSYTTAVLGAAQPAALEGLSPEELAELEGLFDFVSDAVKTVTKAASSAAKATGVTAVVDAVDKAYVAATPQWLRKGLGVVAAPTKFVWDSVDNIAHGQRIDRALLEAGHNQIDIFKSVAPIAQLGLSFLPGVGTTAAGVLGAAVALADGKRITDALIASVAGAMPGGPLVAKAVDIGAHAAVGLAEGKPLESVALDAVRNNLPGGEAARIAFDTGLALAQGKKIQEAGLSAAAHLVPNNPVAQGAFEMTKRALAGKPLEGSTRTAMKRVEAHGFPVRRPPPMPRRAPITRAPMARATRAPMRTAAAPPPAASSSVVPIAIGAAALAAAGGGAWWWWSKNKAPNRGAGRSR